MNAMRKMTRMVALLGVACLLAIGCQDYTNTHEKVTYQAPLLTGEQDAETFVDLVGGLDFGAQASGNFSTQKILTGYVFSANPGARVTLTLTAANGEDPVLVVYGPLSEQGIWGRAIVQDDDAKDGRNSAIHNFSLPGGGRYLIGAATYDGAVGGPFTVDLGCNGECTDPYCGEVMCDLYCPFGFMSDPNGCAICRCVEPQCQTDEDCWSPDGIPGRCLNGACVFGEDYQCSDMDPTCPEGFECVLDACTEPQCDPATGECWACSGYCRPVEPPQCFSDEECIANGVAGRCINGRCIQDALPCDMNEQCPAGMICEMMCPACPPDVGDCPPCMGFCVLEGPPACDEATPCPAGMVCAMECWSCEDPTQCPEPVCQGICVPDQVECYSDQDCIYPDGTVGFCAEGRCVFQQIPCLDTSECPPGQECLVACMDCDPTDPDCLPGCQGFCAPVVQPQCYSDYDCYDAAGNVGRCVNGLCVFEPLRCRLDYDCPPNNRCDIVECDPNCADPLACCWGICVPNGQPQCFSDMDCIAPDGMPGRCVQGYCIFDGCACPEVWDPVCGVDGQTYANACFADCAGVPIAFWGECSGQPGECFSDLDCPAGTYCELFQDPTMPPEQGGVCLPLPVMECLADADCPEGFRCEAGLCPGMPCDPATGECPTCWGQCVPAEGGCIQTGCSGEICAPYPVNSSCVWLPEYECLQFSRCELLMDAAGQQTCGWFQTDEYLACLERIQGGGECQADSDCPAGSFCALACYDCMPEDPNCLPGCQGTCVEQGCTCPDVYDPVCAADAAGELRTFGNACEASCANAQVLYWGECQ